MIRFKTSVYLSARTILFSFVVFSFALIPAQVVIAQETSEQESANDTSTPHEFEQYVGTYGERIFTFSGGTLYFRNERMPSRVSLKPLGDDSFEVIIPPGAQVRTPAGDGEVPTFLFNRDESGNVESFSLVDSDGVVMVTSKRDQE